MGAPSTARTRRSSASATALAVASSAWCAKGRQGAPLVLAPAKTRRGPPRRARLAARASWRCDHGKLQSIDCAALGLKCTDGRREARLLRGDAGVLRDGEALRWQRLGRVHARPRSADRLRRGGPHLQRDARIYLRRRVRSDPLGDGQMRREGRGEVRWGDDQVLLRRQEAELLLQVARLRWLREGRQRGSLRGLRDGAMRPGPPRVAGATHARRAGVVALCGVRARRAGGRAASEGAARVASAARVAPPADLLAEGTIATPDASWQRFQRGVGGRPGSCRRRSEGSSARRRGSTRGSAPRSTATSPAYLVLAGDPAAPSWLLAVRLVEERHARPLFEGGSAVFDARDAGGGVLALATKGRSAAPGVAVGIAPGGWLVLGGSPAALRGARSVRHADPAVEGRGAERGAVDRRAAGGARGERRDRGRRRLERRAAGDARRRSRPPRRPRRESARLRRSARDRRRARRMDPKRARRAPRSSRRARRDRCWATTA